MRWLERVNRWFRLVLDPRQSYRHAFVEELPDAIDDGVVYLVGDDPKPWAAAFRCPCKCGETVWLSLIPRDDPSWRARVLANGRISLSPSIWRKKGCRSHFFIRDGRVLWAKSTVR